jgi:hypothetical protein
MLPADVNYIFYQPALMQTGDIRTSSFRFQGTNVINQIDEYGSDEIRFKNRGPGYRKVRFDENKLMFDRAEDMFALLGIPDYQILTFDFDRDETTFTVPLPVKKDITADSSGFYQNGNPIARTEGFFSAEELIKTETLKFSDAMGQQSHTVRSLISSTYPFSRWSDYEKLMKEIEYWLKDVYQIKIDPFAAYDIVDTARIYEPEETEVEPRAEGGLKLDFQRDLSETMEALNPQPKPGTYKVIIGFVVRSNGSLTDFTPLTESGYRLEELLFNLMNKRKWWPARIKRTSVHCKQVFSVNLAF